MFPSASSLFSRRGSPFLPTLIKIIHLLAVAAAPPGKTKKSTFSFLFAPSDFCSAAAFRCEATRRDQRAGAEIRSRSIRAIIIYWGFFLDNGTEQTSSSFPVQTEKNTISSIPLRLINTNREQLYKKGKPAILGRPTTLHSCGNLYPKKDVVKIRQSGCEELQPPPPRAL